ncbi:hypothetical protein HDU81_003037 [Chytriomyces hyalinus]|nr:hypothetical protein HDU81_003037 [Chytriomyces hyalinus]
MKLTAVLPVLAALASSVFAVPPPQKDEQTKEFFAAKAAMQAVAAPPSPITIPTAVSFQSVVNPLIAKVDVPKIEAWLTKLTLFPERFYKSNNGVAAAKWIRDTVQNLTAPAGTKLTVSLYTHANWIQPTVIARYEAATATNLKGIVITGTHFDTYAINHPNGVGGANPAADDCASGSSALFESLRILTTNGFVPGRPIEFHWYAAEEAGLLGSYEIAKDYASKAIPVVAYLNLDQSGYVKKGTTPVIGIFSDYTTAAATKFVTATAKAYSGLPVVENQKCGYECTDNAAWYDAGYNSALAFESTNANAFPYNDVTNTDGTPLDTIDKVDMNHVAAFAKNTIGFIVELSLVGGSVPSPTTAAPSSSAPASKTTTTAVRTSSAAGACAHDVCTAGTKLVSTCSACAKAICAADSYCCSNSWDATCVSEVAQYCTGLAASGLTARSTKSTPTAALRVDMTAQYAHEDRLRVAARRDRDRSDSEDEPGPKVSGVRVFALSARKSRTLLTPTRQSESGKAAPATPSLLSAAKLQRSITLSNETEVPSTPLKRSSRLASALNPLNVLSPASPTVGTPKRATRSSVAATPRGRTPDMKRAAKQRVEEILNESESDSEDEEEEDDEEEEMEEDDENAAESHRDHMDPYASIASAVERGDDDDDGFVEASRFGHKESDFDRDVKRRGKVRANVEDYFTESSTQKGPKRNQTSNNTLASLPTLSREEYLSALTTMPQKHVREREGLTFLIPSYFRQWNFELSQGYSLLLYGYGSKRSIVSMFKDQFCKDAPVMTLNGYMPVVNFATDVLAKIVTNIVLPESSNGGIKSSPASKTASTRKPITPAAQIAAIASYFKNPDRTHSHITLLINNIDGPSLRSEKQQILISTLLRTCPRGTLRLVATVDHINAPLLWDRSTADAFHWLWKDVTTYEPYFEETQYGALCFVPEAKGGVKGGVSGGESGSSASGAVHVLRSLNQNARRMFKILADWQLLESRSNNEVESGVVASNRKGRKRKATRKGGKAGSGSDDEEHADSTADEGQSPDRNDRNTAPATAGMPYNAFLTRCIESFCVNSQDNFKAQLAEFRDHGIILRKRGSSMGEEVVYIPFGKDALESILSQVTV